MHIDLYTEQGRHFHFDFHSPFNRFKVFINKLVATRQKQRADRLRLRPDDRPIDTKNINIHADQACRHRHARTYIGPL